MHEGNWLNLIPQELQLSPKIFYEIRAVPPFPLLFTNHAVGALTLHTGVRNLHMKHQDMHKIACQENEAGSLPGWYEEYHKDTTIFFFVKNKRRNKKVRVSISLFYAVLN